MTGFLIAISGICSFKPLSLGLAELSCLLFSLAIIFSLSSAVYLSFFFLCVISYYRYHSPPLCASFVLPLSVSVLYFCSPSLSFHSLSFLFFRPVVPQSRVQWFNLYYYLWNKNSPKKPKFFIFIKLKISGQRVQQGIHASLKRQSATLQRSIILLKISSRAFN